MQATFKDYELASKIGGLMKDRVCFDLRTWLDIGLDFGSFAINAAPAEFLRDDFAEQMLARLARHAIDPSLIEVEVTEHTFLNRGSALVTRALHLLREAGVRVALDDFRTGHSSLAHLRDFPVDVVKIDRSFVNQTTGNHEVRAIVAAVVDPARQVSIDVVAEGVENELQRELLLAMGSRPSGRRGVASLQGGARPTCSRSARGLIVGRAQRIAEQGLGR